MNLQVEPPEKTKTKSENSSPPPSPPSFSLLPDEITVDCLARISRSYYPTLSIVSKRFRLLLSSTELYAARSHLGRTEKCVYVCLSDSRLLSHHQHPQWFRLWINPNRTLPNSMIKKKKKKKTIGQLLVPIPASNLPSMPSVTTVAVGAEIYAIGGPVDGAPSSAVRVLDCRSDTWRDAPSMNVARRYALSCVYDGKIYVFGGVDEEEPWGEVYDTKSQTWERLPDPGTEVRKRGVWIIREVEGKIYIGDNRKKNVYDTKQCKWECGKGKGKGLVASSELFSTSYKSLQCNVYDVEEGYWKPVKGLHSLEDKYRKNGGRRGQIVRCGEKLFVIWEGRTRIIPYNRRKIWCAEIELQKRHGGEIWGNVEWVDVVHTVPTECRILHCHVVSV